VKAELSQAQGRGANTRGIRDRFLSAQLHSGLFVLTSKDPPEKSGGSLLPPNLPFGQRAPSRVLGTFHLMHLG
jgi:hypothetical protein